MLSLSKRVDYALIALAYLSERPGRMAPAREIADAYELPLPLLMNILKTLHQHGMVQSLRGVKGGYRIGIDPAAVSLHELILAIEGPMKITECVGSDPCSDGDDCRVSRSCPVQAPLQALHHRLMRFFRDVKLSDIILAGHRIDVPREKVGLG